MLQRSRVGWVLAALSASTAILTVSSDGLVIGSNLGCRYNGALRWGVGQSVTVVLFSVALILWIRKPAMRGSGLRVGLLVSALGVVGWVLYILTASCIQS